MNISLSNNTSPLVTDLDCVVVPVYAGNLSGSAKQIDEASKGAISQLLALGHFYGRKSSTEILYHLQGVSTSRLLLVGCGNPYIFDSKVAGELAKTVAVELKKLKVASAEIWLLESLNDEQAAQQFISSLLDSQYELLDYKNKESTQSLETIALAGTNSEQGMRYGEGIASGVTLAKNLANHPGNICTPTYLAKTAKTLAKQHDKLSVEVLEEVDMEALGMGSLLSVSQGSVEPAKLIIMNYQGVDDGSQPIVLVGKGITFDSGGISLKPGGKMDEMKFDMGGAASVFGTMQAIVDMQLPINVVGVVASAENMPSSRATKPGDIVTSMSGKTIEVLNTDAEGRLVLCDALTYIERFNPKLVIDIATLTGACIVALGHHICAIISNNDNLADSIMSAGEQCQDKAWRLPMNSDFTKQLRSEFADLGNIGGPEGGTITAGCFLAEFTQKYTWAHLDVAGTAWSGKAATGRPVPLLTQFIINQL
ncbi:MAG: leucyl aminopeptidase [Thiotrichaceae bacterium]|nr:leucyl aminopeptidase [Thiotrichaceae bacterium]